MSNRRVSTLPRLGRLLASLLVTVWLFLFGIAEAEQPSARKSSIRDDRLGVCVHFSQGWPVESVMPMIAQLGVGWIRDDVPWREIERRKGYYEIPANTRRWITAAKRHGLKILLILNFGNPIYSDPFDPKAYARAAAWLARELKDDIQAIEVLNEPNNFGFRDAYGGAWNGFEPDRSVSPYVRRYVDLLNAAAQAVKAANASMKVIGLGAPPPASFRMIELGLVSEVDGITDHPYSMDIPEIIPYSADADRIKRDGIATADANGTFISQVAMFRTQAKTFGATQEVWHTEWGHPTTKSSPEKEGLSGEGQAVYILRRILESHAIGVERSFIYIFKDEGLDPYSDYENFGLVRHDLSKKKAFFAVQRTTALLASLAAVPRGSDAGASIRVDRVTDPTDLRCYTFVGSKDGTKAVAFWNTAPWTTSLSALSATITLPSPNKTSQAWIYDLLSGERKAVVLKSEQEYVSANLPISSIPQLLVITPTKSP